MTDQRFSLYDLPHFFAPRASESPTCRCGKPRHAALHLTPGDAASMQRSIDATGERGRSIAREHRPRRSRQGGAA